MDDFIQTATMRIPATLHRIKIVSEHTQLGISIRYDPLRRSQVKWTAFGDKPGRGDGVTAAEAVDNYLSQLVNLAEMEW